MISVITNNFLHPFYSLVAFEHINTYSVSSVNEYTMTVIIIITRRARSSGHEYSLYDSAIEIRQQHL